MKHFIIGVLVGLGAMWGFLSYAPSANQGEAFQGGIDGTNITQKVVATFNTSTTSTAPAVINVNDFQLVTYTVATQAASNTLRFACSLSDTAPDFTVATSTSNQYVFVDVTDDSTDGSIDGGVGITHASTTDMRQFTVTPKNHRWCTVKFSGLPQTTIGTTTVWMRPMTNQ